MSFEEIVKTLGLPGLLICVWYLLELQKARRAEKADEAKNKLEERRLDLEERRTQAMTAGFQLLSTKIDEHQRDEFEHHATTREAIVGMHTSFANHFDLTPPPQTPPRTTTRDKGRAETPGRGTYFHRTGTKGGGE